MCCSVTHSQMNHEFIQAMYLEVAALIEKSFPIPSRPNSQAQGIINHAKCQILPLRCQFSSRLLENQGDEVYVQAVLVFCEEKALALAIEIEFSRMAKIALEWLESIAWDEGHQLQGRETCTVHSNSDRILSAASSFQQPTWVFRCQVIRKASVE